jgi:hypothetical protein
VLAVEIVEASAKRRTGVPETDDTGGANQAWAGVIPLITFQGEALPSPFV